MTVHVICDFDGTISQRDMITAIMERFVPKESRPIIDAVKAGRQTVKEGVEAMFELIPSNHYDEVARYAQEHTQVRRGFPQFIHTCVQLGWKLSVVSGGFDFFVMPVIHKFSTDAVDIYCNHLDTSGPRLRVQWSHPCDQACEGGCGLCKPSVIRQRVHSGDGVIVIGDGVTDFKAAKMADFVFARAQLLKLVEERRIPHLPFATFDDIIAAIDDKEGPLHAHIQ
ncbi:2-hydroxy-3-keto-5-methylthiopentenyl-1-phosphate phosphatase [Alicyclobacillus sacchari]|uniref:2-hydroxy-3-keto-5-methylthiopentenyl-1-phosphate phosphatase n=1 Tax=Alicyclobacillus sacchari TaxID=392010 RepID=A0A4V3HEB1_9BACL|nr:MtnX-like HAD-IB family phosphatase [Alicyclobacillus sacchari]TDY46298.1 2-hydroxy-3-keto-5-methylthiopentenyl-1-phosphate phosphatase [Alicyclobacillus sacchari]